MASPSTFAPHHHRRAPSHASTSSALPGQQAPDARISSVSSTGSRRLDSGGSAGAHENSAERAGRGSGKAITAKSRVASLAHHDSDAPAWSGSSPASDAHTPLSSITNRARNSLSRTPRGSFGAPSHEGDKNTSGDRGDDDGDMSAGKRPSRSSMAPPTAKTARYGALSSDDRGAVDHPSSRQPSISGQLQAERGPRRPSAIGGPPSRMASMNSAGTGQRVPSVLRRLPPGVVAPRSAVPSASHSSDPDSSFQQHSSSSSGSGNGSLSRVPGVAALARANQRGPRGSLGASINAAANGGVVQHDRDGREIVKLNVDSTSFEEWMKMATDNKINATNTWNFALIDYFHDMSLLRSDNGDGSINFQKASCTLDGCVKVWTSRVDSVVVETGKLLSGLQDDGKDAAKGRGRRGGEDEDGEGLDDGDEEGAGTGRRKRARAKEPTLVKSFAQIAVKKLDLEFTVDPLFKKTSADFDEGGAGGLLMNHLGVDSKARVVFDASDVPGQDDVDADGVAEADDDDASDVTETGDRPQLESENMLDLTKIRNKFFGHYHAGAEEDAMSSFLSSMTICPTFASFRFAPDDNTPFSEIVNANLEDFQIGTPSAFGESQGWDGDLNDGFAFEDDGLDDAFGGPNLGSGTGLFGGGEDDPFTMHGDGFEGADIPGDDIFGGGGPSASAPINFTESLQGLVDGSGPSAGDDFFGYFDQRLTKNWAGPEHWKMRNLGPNGMFGASAGASSSERGVTARKSKEPFVIDFTSPEGAITSRELFETARGGTGTLLPAVKDGLEDLYLLPEDRHFSSKQLLRLFIKPRATLKIRRRRANDVAEGEDGAETARWLHGQGLGNADDEGGFGALELGFDAGEDHGGMPEVPFDTQFFHEDDNGFDLDDGAEQALALEPEDEEELATQALKRIRPEFVNYAKKAKRVDVRKLKENIWKELGIAVDVEEEDASGSDADESLREEGWREESPATEVKRDPTEPRTFETVLSGLRKLYSKERMDEISTSFCFICLLHLANEEGLRIKPQDTSNLGSFGALGDQPIVEDDEDEGAQGMEADEDNDLPRTRLRKTISFATPAKDSRGGRNKKTLGLHDGEDDAQGLENVTFLEQLCIAKDPNAGRSA